MQVLAGTFATGADVAGVGDQQSGVLEIPSGVANVVINTLGVDTNNRLRVQKSTDSGSTWSNVSTFTTDQVNTVVGVTKGEQYRFITFVMQANHDLRYKASLES